MTYMPYEQAIAARATAIANQAILQNVYTPATFGRTDWDTTNGLMRPALDSKIIAPYAGWYRARGAAYFDGTGGQARAAIVSVNGSYSAGIHVTNTFNNFAGGVLPHAFLPVTFHCNANDYVQLVANPQSSGDTLIADGATYGSFLVLELVSIDGAF